MSSLKPYLSIVAASRNDNHGGNLLTRMQAFVNALVAQCRKYDLPAELILVEWNPPPDRPRLHAALRWPHELGPCRVRLVEVPPALHCRRAHADRLPLFQMIAKNVGIRRARGEWILATNIDILFSDDLFAFLARRCLRKGQVYRLDRYDVEADIPAEANGDELLAYCRDHVIRVNTNRGTFALGPQGKLIHPRLAWGCLETKDIAAAELGLRFGPGWYPPEFSWSGAYRWAESEAVLILPASVRPLAFALWIEPGPALESKPFPLRVSDTSGRTVAQSFVTGRHPIVLALPGRADTLRRYTLHTPPASQTTGHDTRCLAYRVFGPILAADAIRGLPGRWVLRRGTALVPPLVRSVVRHVRHRLRAFQNPGKSALPLTPSVPLPQLHTTACGDFTLMARDDWFRIGGYPELEVFSLHLDQLLLYIAHYHGLREVILPDPMRIYHIDHAVGSGWTPEGSEQLMTRMQQLGIPVLDTASVLQWAREMANRQRSLSWNGEQWGLAQETLPEQIIGTQEHLDLACPC